MSSNKLYRDEQYKKIGGVCAGLAEYFNVDVTLVRVLFVLAAVLGGGGVLGYFILWVVVPPKPWASPSDEFFNSTQSQPQYQARPFTGVKKRDHKPRYIGGSILILLGIYILLEENDLIPDVRFNVVAPVAIIIIGLVFIFGYWAKHPEQPNNDNFSSTDNSQTI